MQEIYFYHSSLRGWTSGGCGPLRHSDIPAGSEILSPMTSLPLAVLPDRTVGLFLRANLPGWKIHQHLAVLEQFQQHPDAIRAGQACIEDGFVACERPGMNHDRPANFLMHQTILRPRH